MGILDWLSDFDLLQPALDFGDFWGIDRSKSQEKRVPVSSQSDLSDSSQEVVGSTPTPGVNALEKNVDGELEFNGALWSTIREAFLTEKKWIQGAKERNQKSGLGEDNQSDMIRMDELNMLQNILFGNAIRMKNRVNKREQNKNEMDKD
jgi:hypothetical protein